MNNYSIDSEYYPKRLKTSDLPAYCAWQLHYILLLKHYFLLYASIACWDISLVWWYSEVTQKTHIISQQILPVTYNDSILLIFQLVFVFHSHDLDHWRHERQHCGKKLLELGFFLFFLRNFYDWWNYEEENQVKIDLTIDKNSEMLSYFILVSFRLLELPWKPHPVWSPCFPFSFHPSAWGLKMSWKGTKSECSKNAPQAWVLWVLTEICRQNECVFTETEPDYLFLTFWEHH